MVGSGNLGAQQHWSAAHCLLDDPAALRHAGNELQHGVPLLVGCRVMQVPRQEPAHHSTPVRLVSIMSSLTVATTLQHVLSEAHDLRTRLPAVV